ncbi:MAG: hypothetical protein GQ557_01365, partial [Mycoplasmataceae bacterium]|nr:hypothetical protein [Mycoplasmataceae bacterium]
IFDYLDNDEEYHYKEEIIMMRKKLQPKVITNEEVKEILNDTTKEIEECLLVFKSYSEHINEDKTLYTHSIYKIYEKLFYLKDIKQAFINMQEENISIKKEMYEQFDKYQKTIDYWAEKCCEFQYKFDKCEEENKELTSEKVLKLPLVYKMPKE